MLAKYGVLHQKLCVAINWYFHSPSYYILKLNPKKGCYVWFTSTIFCVVLFFQVWYSKLDKILEEKTDILIKKGFI